MAIPNAPTNLVLHPSVGLAPPYLTWNDNSNNETDFYVYVSYNGSTFNIVSQPAPNDNTYTLSLKTSPNGTYDYKVTAHNTSGESAATNTVSFAWNQVVPPAPSNFHIKNYPDVANAVFSFTNNSSTYENKANYFLIYLSNDGVNFFQGNNIGNNSKIGHLTLPFPPYLTAKYAKVAGYNGLFPLTSDFSNVIDLPFIQSIDISNTIGLGDLTEDDLNIAKNKGWLIITDSEGY